MSYRNYYSLCKPTIADVNSVKFVPKNCSKTNFNVYKYPYTTFHPYLAPGEIRSVEANVSCAGGSNLTTSTNTNIIYDQQLPSFRREFNTIGGDIREGFVHPSKMEHLNKPVIKEVPVVVEKPVHSSCGVDSSGNNACGMEGLFPVLDPRFNMREAAKQLILLEDHLAHEKKRCRDCILKHILTIEGFLEEGITIDNNREYNTELNNSLANFREAIKGFLVQIDSRVEVSNQEYHTLSQKLRQIRKPLCQTYGSFSTI